VGDDFLYNPVGRSVREAMQNLDYPASLHAQYRLSNNVKGSLLFDLTSYQEFQQLIKTIQPLVVSPHPTVIHLGHHTHT
jgi:hypothetical protein